jgi:hypothetical protein
VHQFRRLPVRHSVYIHKAVKTREEACAHHAFVVRTAGVADNLETLPIMALDQFDHQLPDGMRAKVAGEVAEPDPSTSPRPRMRERRRNPNFFGNPTRTIELLRRRGIQAQHDDGNSGCRLL